MGQPVLSALPRGYFAIGAERISKALNLGNLMRSAHGFGASFTFTIGATYQALEARADTSKGQQHLPHYNWAERRRAGAAAGLPAGRASSCSTRRSTCRASAIRCARPTCWAPSRARCRRSCWRAATTSCASPRASASTSPWPAPSSCTTGCAAWDGSAAAAERGRARRVADAGPEAGTRPALTARTLA